MNVLSMNLSHLYTGYYKDEHGVYHVVFQPYDAYKVFAHLKPLLPQKTIVNDLAKDIKITDDTTLTIQGSTANVHVDGLSDSSNQEFAVGLGGKMNQYSLNGGKWRRTPDFIGSGECVKYFV